MMIAPNSRAHKGEGGSEGGVWKNLREGGGECWLRGNGATQSATCCAMRKRGWEGIWHERFGNGMLISAVICLAKVHPRCCQILPQHCAFFPKASSQLIVIFIIFSTADCIFGLFFAETLCFLSKSFKSTYRHFYYFFNCRL